MPKRVVKVKAVRRVKATPKRKASAPKQKAKVPAKRQVKMRPFDAAKYLRNEKDMAAYLDVVLEDNDPALLAAALGDIARARGMAELAESTGLSRESLYKGLSGERVPSTETLMKVMHALGLRLSVAAA